VGATTPNGKGVSLRSGLGGFLDVDATIFEASTQLEYAGG